MPPPRSNRSLEVNVKSSLRTLQILEFMDSMRRAVTVADLSANLNIPQSSTSALVQSMVNMGYVIVERDGRHLLPSSRVAALGSWIEPAVSRADIRALMVAVSERTHQTILLGVPSDLCVRYIDAIPGRHTMRLDIPIGSRLPLTEAGMGRLLLSEMDPDVVAELWKQTKQRVATGGSAALNTSDVCNLWNERPSVSSLPSIVSEMRKIRKRGYALSLGRVSMGAGIVCVALPHGPGEQPMGLGVGGLSDLIAKDAASILDCIRGSAAALKISLKLAKTQTVSGSRRT